MRLRDQIIAASCAGWVSLLGTGIYFACEARPSRAGVIREGLAGGTRHANPGAQDAQSRPGNQQPTPGESAGANPRSPGFAQYRLKPCSAVLPESRVVGSWECAPSDGSAQGVRLALSPEKTKATSREPGRGNFQPYVLTAYSHTCILPKWGPEPPPQPMASGEWPVAGLHVAGPPEMAFGTVLEVVYKGLPSRLIVGDRGRAIKGRRLDLFLATCRAARAWGRRTAYVREVSE